MPNIDSEISASRTQFVYHNFFKDTRGRNLTAEVSQIKERGLWSPVDYSIITPDIFFLGGGIRETVTIICATPHQRSNEVGIQHPWQKVRLMESDGRVYPPEDDAVPAGVRKVFAEKPNTEELAKKGFRQIPPPDLKAIIEWGDEASMFRWACNEGLRQYIRGQATELGAVAIIGSLSFKIPMTMEILDPSFSREEIFAGVAKSATKLSLTEENEEILQALADLETGKVKAVNEYLAPYYEDIDTFAYDIDGKKDAIIWDKKELSRRIGEMVDRVMEMKPSYSDTEKVQEEYLVRIFSAISSQSI